jgi:hypothetical protein
VRYADVPFKEYFVSASYYMRTTHYLFRHHNPCINFIHYFTTVENVNILPDDDGNLPTHVVKLYTYIHTYTYTQILASQIKLYFSYI